MDDGRLDQDKRLIQALLLKWRQAEREHAQSEQLWQEKLETCLTAEDLGGDHPWKKSEEAWFLKEKPFQIHVEGLLLSMERKLEEDSGECPDLYELQEQFCERRLHLESRRSQWLQKDAWFQMGEASQNQIEFQKNRIFTLKAKITSLEHEQATICEKCVENALTESMYLSDKLEEKAKLTLRESNLQEQLALKEKALVQAQLDALNKDQQHIQERLQWMQQENARTNVFMDRFNSLSQRFGQPPLSEEEMRETHPHLEPTPLSQEGETSCLTQNASENVKVQEEQRHIETELDVSLEHKQTKELLLKQSQDRISQEFREREMKYLQIDKDLLLLAAKHKLHKDKQTEVEKQSQNMAQPQIEPPAKHQINVEEIFSAGGRGIKCTASKTGESFYVSDARLFRQFLSQQNLKGAKECSEPKVRPIRRPGYIGFRRGMLLDPARWGKPQRRQEVNKPPPQEKVITAEDFLSRGGAGLKCTLNRTGEVFYVSDARLFRQFLNEQECQENFVWIGEGSETNQAELEEKIHFVEDCLPLGSGKPLPFGGLFTFSKSKAKSNNNLEE